MYVHRHQSKGRGVRGENAPSQKSILPPTLYNYQVLEIYKDATKLWKLTIYLAKIITSYIQLNPVSVESVLA